MISGMVTDMAASGSVEFSSAWLTCLMSQISCLGLFQCALEMQNEALSNYSGDLEEITNDIKSLKKEDAEAGDAVSKATRKLNRLQKDVYVAQKDEDVSPSEARCHY